MRLFACRCSDPRKAARRLLVAGLREQYGLDHLPDMARGSCGKPFFPDFPHIHFNVSHSGSFALCAVGDSPVGVDIEAVRPRNPALIAKVLTQEEYHWYEANGGGWSGFYTLWTRKESFCKYEGGSVLHPQKVCPPLPGRTGAGPAVTSLSGDDWQAAVCTQEALEPLLWMDFLFS